MWNDNEFSYFSHVLFDHWINQRNIRGRSLLRKYWKSEGINDFHVKIAFQSRGNYREKMKLRNSKKNELESQENVWHI